MDRADASARMDAGLLKSTGRTMAEWVAEAKRFGIEKHRPLVEHLKGRGLTHGYANSIALQALGTHAEAIGAAALLKQMFV